MVRILKVLATEIEGRDVLLVEDIVDTGLTLDYLIKNLRSRNPASVEVLSLPGKPLADAREAGKCGREGGGIVCSHTRDRRGELLHDRSQGVGVALGSSKLGELLHTHAPCGR